MPFPRDSVWAVVVGLVAIVVVLATLVIATDVFLLAFLALLFAIFLRGMSGLIQRAISLRYTAALGLVVLSLVVASIAGTLLVGVRVEQRLSEVGESLEQALVRLHAQFERYPTAQAMLQRLPVVGSQLGSDEEQSSGPPSEAPRDVGGRPAADTPSPQGGSIQWFDRLLATTRGMFMSTIGALASCVLVFFAGIYLAANPRLYVDGCVRLFAPRYRPRAEHALEELCETLWHWLRGRLASMAITGVGTGITLGLLGAPLAVTLGTITGLLTFIPNIGPAIALALAVLVALPEGSGLALAVAVVFVVWQLIESYLITPLIQQREVSLAPAVLLFFQMLMSVLAGFLGLLVASPILAGCQSLIKTLYIDGYLHAEDDPADADKVRSSDKTEKPAA